VLGARLAADDARGNRATTRVAMVTAVLGVTAIVGAATYASSMDGLLGSPERQGWTWDVSVGNYADPDTVAVGAAALDRHPEVEEYVGYNWATYEVDGRPTTLLELEHPSPLLPTVLEGRAPSADDEVAFGRGTLADLGKSIGDTVEITAVETVRATIVGEIVAPAVLAPPMDLDSGGLVTMGLGSTVFDDTSIPVGHAVELRGDVDLATARADLDEDFPRTVVGPMRPLDVASLDRVRGIPVVVAGLLGAMALVSVAVTLTTASRRRRRDLAVLRSVGLARAQVRRLFAGESSAFTLATLVLGVPLGVAVGRLAWTLAADGLGSELDPTVPLLAVLLGALLVLALVNLYGQWLAFVVGRRRPGGDLRSE
jgi:hypothetical protein